MSEFSIPPYIYFYPSDWLQNPEVRRLPADVKGFYIDLICQLHFSFPYGYCSLLDPVKIKKLGKLVNQNPNQEVNHRVDLLLSLSVAEQLKIAQNIESELSTFLPYKEDVIALYIKKLEENNIISRSSAGIIYVRRMVKDFKRRVVAYSNGSKGGNPNMKNRTKAEKPTKRGYNKRLTDNGLQNLPNQIPNQHGKPTADPIYNNINTGRVREKGESLRGENIPSFQMQDLYEKSFKDLADVSYSKVLTEEGLAKWKKFVDWVTEKNYQDLYISKFINPPDFETLYNKGFTEEKWVPVIERILATGIKPEHSLFFRIPEFIKIVYGDPKFGNNSKAVKASTVAKVGNKDFSGMKGVAKSRNVGP